MYLIIKFVFSVQRVEAKKTIKRCGAGHCWRCTAMGVGGVSYPDRAVAGVHFHDPVDRLSGDGAQPPLTVFRIPI